MKKKFILMTVIAVLITTLVAVIPVGSVFAVDSVAGNSEGRRYWAKESFTIYNRKGTIKDGTDDLYATRITLKIPPKESSKDMAGSDTDSADQG